jgi:hypothetical protein
MDSDTYSTTGDIPRFVPIKSENDEFTLGFSDKDRIKKLERDVEELTRRVSDLEWQRI